MCWYFFLKDIIFYKKKTHFDIFLKNYTYEIYFRSFNPDVVFVIKWETDCFLSLYLLSYSLHYTSINFST